MAEAVVVYALSLGSDFLTGEPALICAKEADQQKQTHAASGEQHHDIALSRGEEVTKNAAMIHDLTDVLKVAFAKAEEYEGTPAHVVHLMETKDITRSLQMRRVDLDLAVEAEKEWREKAEYQMKMAKAEGQRRDHNVAEWMHWVERR
jgi:hypothetical protein